MNNETKLAIDTLTTWRKCPARLDGVNCPLDDGCYCEPAPCWSVDDLGKAIDVAIGVMHEKQERDRQPGGWISVEDELPGEVGLDVLIFRQSEDIDAFIDIGYLIDGVWRSTSDGWRLYDVTHWMPLPLIPNEAAP